MARLAIVMNRVPRRGDMDTSSVDAEEIIDLATVNDILVLADRESEALEQLRDHGVQVNVSSKRFLDIDGGLFGADALQARRLLAFHDDGPVEMVLYADDTAVDLSWFEPRLADIPFVTVVGQGPLADSRLVASDPDLVDRVGRSLWQAVSIAASADLVLAPGSLESLGLDPRAFGPTVLPSDMNRKDEAPPFAQLVVAIARSAAPRDLGTLFGRVWSVTQMAESTTIVIVHADRSVGKATTSDIILSGVPASKQEQVVLTAVGDDGVARRFVESADLIVGLSDVDVGSPLVRSVSERIPTIVLSAPDAPDVWDGAVAPRSRPTFGLVAIDAGIRQANESIDAVARSCDVVVLYEPQGADVAARLASMPLRQADTYLAGSASGVFGSVAPVRVSPHVAGIRSDIWFAMRDDLSRFGSIWDVIRRIASIDQMEYLRQLIVPIDGCRVRPISVLQSLGPVFGGRGPLPRPAVRLVEPANPPTSDAGSVTAPEDSARAWAKRHSWGDRARLALPWKWGLLPRSMKGRW